MAYLMAGGEEVNWWYSSESLAPLQELASEEKGLSSAPTTHGLVGTTVKAKSTTQGAPCGKRLLGFTKGQKIKIAELQEENGEWYAAGSDFPSLWFPLSSTDWGGRELGGVVLAGAPNPKAGTPGGPVFGRATTVKIAEYPMEHLRIIGVDNSSSIPKVDVLPEVFVSLFSVLEPLPPATSPKPLFGARTPLPLLQKLEAEENLEEDVRAPALPRGFEAQMTQKVLKSQQNKAVGKKFSRHISPESDEVEAYAVIAQFHNFISWRDRAGNSVAHHLANAGLHCALQAVCNANKSLRWAENDSFETPMMITDGLTGKPGGRPGIRLSPAKRALHRAISKGNFFKIGFSGVNDDGNSEHICKLKRMAMRCPDDFDTPQGDLSDISKCLQTPGQAAKGLDIASKSLDLHSCIYNATAMLDLKMGIKQVSIQVDRYLQKLLETTDENAFIDPMLYYVYYFMWKKYGTNRRSERLRAAFALTALRSFPKFAEGWVDAEDNIDAKVKAEGLMEEEESDMDDEEEELDDAILSKDSPEAEWQLAKADHKLAADAMDQLMALTGLREIKKKAMGVVKEVLLQKGRPASVKAETSMNFLFTGNPGCGKTTVAQLLARAMNQLGFRTNPTMIETSAQDILKSKCPGSEFADMMKNATGGCLFIDEAYRFSPAPSGQQPNASNQVLDFLLEAVEKPEIRSTTTVILAGYRDEIETLLAYNVGFSSRFNKDFSFHDYNEMQVWP